MSIEISGTQTEIIDFHVHSFPDKIAEKAVGKLARISGLTPATDGTISDTLIKMQQYNVDRAVLLNIATSPSQQESINNCAKEINDNFNDKFISFGSVHFDNPNCIAELERISQMGIRGIKLHPDYQGFMIDDEKLFPIYEKCSELNLPIVFHAGWDCYCPDLIHAPPKASRNVLNIFPKLKIVLAHFGGIHCWDDVEKYLIGQNVYLDTAMCCTYANKKQIEKMMKNHDENKILFGTDCPWENPQKTIDYICSMDLTKTQKSKIFSGNAKALLQLV